MNPPHLQTFGVRVIYLEIKNRDEPQMKEKGLCMVP